MKILKPKTHHSALGTRYSALHKRRGQSMVEMAILSPLLVMMLAVVIEGGLALNAWIRVTTAARDATRFTLDSGRPSDTAELVLQKLAGIDFGGGRTMTGSLELNVYIITGSTGMTGTITSWNVDPRYDGDSNPANNTPKVQRSTIQSRLQSQGATASQNINFYIVEVDYNYTPLLGTLMPRGAKIPMSSYAMIKHN